LLVADSLDVGGAERHVVELAAALAACGWFPSIACSVVGALEPLARSAGVPVHPLLTTRAKRRVSLPYSWRLARLVKREGFDLVHAHMYASSMAAALATTVCNVPLIVTEHSQAGWRSPQARCCSRFMYSRAARVVAVSASIRQRLLADDHLAPDRVVTIVNACPTLPDPAPQLSRADLGVPATGPLVGVVARLQPEKGVEHFVQAAALLARHRLETHFLVVGDGPLKDELLALAARLGIQDRIQFLGFRLHAGTLVRLLDVVVMPSLTEGTPLVVLEAMSAGKPIVASAVGGIPEQIRHGAEGLLVPPADPPMLARAIDAVLERPDAARSLGQRAAARAAQSFSPETLLSRTQAVYQAALKRGAASEPGRPSIPSRRAA
jgi:glycosyltransferase involved in cell wall biosynthesis